MKKILLALPLLLIYSCENKPFSGYVVAKEYISGHHCCSEPKTHSIQEAVTHVPVRPIPNQHHHVWQESQFIIHVANKDDVRAFEVDSIDFPKYKILQKVTFK